MNDAGVLVPKTDVGLLEQAINATKQTEPTQVKALLRTFSQEALKGTVIWHKNIIVTLSDAIKKIDAIISRQLAAIMHNEKFSRLEGSWQGLHYLLRNTSSSMRLKFKLLNVTKNELNKDLSRAAEFDQSTLFKKIYSSEFGTPGGEPYGVMLGDYEFSNHPDDINLLTNLSSVAAAGFCPLITAASPQLFGFDGWSDLSKPRDLAKIFAGADYAAWRSLRNADDSRFVSLVMPRVLARLPYGSRTYPIEAFDYEEVQYNNKKLPHNNYCWMNAAYVLGVKIANAFTKYGWCTAMRGAESGGRVGNLPLHVFTNDNGDIDAQCPTEIGITDRREVELSHLGLLPLCHYKNTDYAVFFGAQTIHRPTRYDTIDATANAAIAVRLPYILATSRFAHYLKIMARDKIGSFMEVGDVEKWLNRWILSYVNGNPDSGREMKMRYPLAEAKVKVREVEGSPGSYHAIAWLRPWLQLEELTASMRLVARIPGKKE